MDRDMEFVLSDAAREVTEVSNKAFAKYGDDPALSGFYGFLDDAIRNIESAYDELDYFMDLVGEK